MAAIETRIPGTARSAGTILFCCVLISLLVAVPVLHNLPSDHALHVGTYTITLLGKYLTYAILAVSVDLVWGYLGILSLGHAAFFALGGYVMGMYLMRQIGGRGVYAKTWFTAAYPEAWLFALGLLFVAVTLFLPKGIAGLLARVRRETPADDPPTAGTRTVLDEPGAPT